MPTHAGHRRAASRGDLLSRLHLDSSGRRLAGRWSDAWQFLEGSHQPDLGVVPPGCQLGDAALEMPGLLCQLIDQRSVDAADAGLDDLYRGWQAVAAIAVQDITQRAQQLPRLASYSLPGSLPSLTLAQRLYGDAARADELVALNNVPHAAFMPRSGQRLIP